MLQATSRPQQPKQQQNRQPTNSRTSTPTSTAEGIESPSSQQWQQQQQQQRLLQQVSRTSAGRTNKQQEDDTNDGADEIKGEIEEGIEGAGEESKVGGDVDLFARTWESLDFGVVLDRLSLECRTEMGRRRALVPDFKTELVEVRDSTNPSGNDRNLPMTSNPLGILCHELQQVGDIVILTRAWW